MILAARLVGALLLAAIYVPTSAEMARAWWTHPYAGHGMFVPAFSAFVAWMDRRRLRAACSRGSWAGLPVILLGLGVLALGRWAGSVALEGVSLVVTVAGLVLWSFGARCLKAAAFPVGFLLLMVPLPRPVVDAVTLDLQLFAVGFAGAALDLLDVPFYLDGVLIRLPGITLAVAEVCNGLRFLLALLVVTIAFAQVSQRTLPRKFIVGASAIPIAILANAVRVAAVVLAVQYLGPQAASGFIHNSIAKGVWALTLIPLGVLGLVLRRRRDRRDPEPIAGTTQVNQGAAGRSQR